MLIPQEKYRRTLRPFILMALLFSFFSTYSQIPSENDSIIRVSPGSFNTVNDRISVFSNDSIIRLPDSLIPPASSGKDKSVLFYNTLKAKAFKKPFTKKLYNLMVVSPGAVEKKQVTASSDAGYISYSGKKIRKIQIQRMNVFGGNINSPVQATPSKIEEILNKTHANTNENIIRKNLLMTEGDTISPLLLSDNERILRQLSFINDARIKVVPVSENEVDLVVITKDVYSLGGSYIYKGLKRGIASVFEKNIFGIGHEFGLDIPFDSSLPNSPGFRAHYLINNIWKTFANLNLVYSEGLGVTNYGFSLSRKLISSTTKYAGGICIMQMYTSVDLDTLPVPQPLKYNLQDYWLQRSFLIDKESVSRIIIGARYTNNNVFDRPLILPDSYYYLQRYKMFLGSLAFSIQKYYKTNLVYGYGSTEDIPYGMLISITGGREYNEFNEFRERTYLGTEVAFSRSIRRFGYLYTSASIATFMNGPQSKQGILSLKMNYFSNLLPVGNSLIRNFININYSRGFDRNTDESLVIERENGFSGFRNDSICGNQKLMVCLESVLFSPINLVGFRFAFFGFSDFVFLARSNERIGNGYSLSSIGVGIRIRNNNMVFNTLQLRFSFFPNLPPYSRINNLNVSGQQLLRPENFDSGPPSVIPYGNDQVLQRLP